MLCSQKIERGVPGTRRAMLLAVICLSACTDSSPTAATGTDAPLMQAKRSCDRYGDTASRRGLSPIAIHSGNPFVTAAVEGAAKAENISADRVREHYCLFDLNRSGRNCYIFFNREAGVGGEIYLCVNERTEIEDLRFGE
jgi:hypothetical protein